MRPSPGTPPARRFSHRPAAARLAVGFVVLAVALTACSPIGAPDPYAHVAALQIEPGAVLLTGAGEEKLLVVRAYDAQGRELDLIELSVEWAISDVATVELDAQGTLHTEAQVTSSVDLGFIVPSMY